MQDFQLAWHVGDDHPEWGSAPRKPLIQCDMAHKGELLDSVIGTHPGTGTPMVYHVLRCEICIAIHLWPLPTDADLALFYAREFYQHEKPNMIARYEQDAVWWEKCMHGPLLDAAAQARGSSSTHLVSLLDIGAGPGLLLRTARKQRGWVTWAIEPSPVCAKRLQEANHIVRESLAALREDAMEGRFDIITLWETLEHMSCPEETLLSVWDLLKPGGVVAICVPNEWNPLQIEACQQLQLPHYWVSAPQHVWYFTPKCLQLLLRRTGFDIVDCRGSFPMEQFLLNGRKYVGNDAIGHACHQERMTEELAAVEEGVWPEREALYRENLRYRIGREMIFIARKPHTERAHG